MASLVVGSALAFSALALQWYMGKKADEEQARNEEIRRNRQRRARARKRNR